MRNRALRIGALLLVAGLISGITLAPHASAALIDVDFSPGGGPAQSGAAVIGASGDIWNNLTANNGTGVVLNDTTGTATGVTLTYASNSGTLDAANSPMDAATANLMQDFLAMNGKTITLAGLTPNTAYEIVLYGAGDKTPLNGAVNGGQGTTFTISSVVQKTTEVNPTTPTNGDRMISDGAGVAYTIYGSTTSDGTGAINIGVAYNSTSFSTAPVNGFQIQSVPEPMSLSVLGLAGIALLGRRRRSVMPA